jgi:hypothetical protein
MAGICAFTVSSYPKGSSGPFPVTGMVRPKNKLPSRCEAAEV